MKIAVIEDEKPIREGLVHILNKISPEYQVVGSAENGTEGLKLMEEEMQDLIMLDIKIPDMTVDIKNPTKDWQSFTIYKVNLEVGKWSSAVSWDLFSKMNDNSELVWSIPAGKTKTIVIPYVAYRQLMSESDWEKLDQDNMKLRFSVVQGSITVNVK